MKEADGRTGTPQWGGVGMAQGGEDVCRPVCVMGVGRAKKPL